MATVYRCDKCHYETERDTDITTVTTPIFNQYQHDMDSWVKKSTDLCGRCIRDLNEFMKPLPKQAKND